MLRRNEDKKMVLILLFTYYLFVPTIAVSAEKGRDHVTCVEDSSDELPSDAVAAIIGTHSSAYIRKLFAHYMKLRGECISDREKPKYWRELKAKPELRTITIYDAGSAQSQAVLKIVKPVLVLYERNWDIAVIKQDAPFIGVFRQCILIVSTGLLRLVTEEELKGFAAHELAHECFIEELRGADRTGCFSSYHLAEFKCDLIAVMACLLLKTNPLSLASGVSRIEAYYLKNEPSILRENKHPSSQQRRRCVEMFLAKIR